MMTSGASDDSMMNDARKGIAYPIPMRKIGGEKIK
jgi:hypothetical protein